MNAKEWLGSFQNQWGRVDIEWEAVDELRELSKRDEPKPVLHENVMKQFGKCPVCNSSVAIQFHSDFCGKCGNRLKWRGEGK